MRLLNGSRRQPLKVRFSPRTGARLALALVVLLSLHTLRPSAYADDGGLAELLAAGNRWAYSEGVPFLPTSEWNTPLAADAAVDPLSDSYIDRMAPSLRNGSGGFWVDRDEWTVPVWYADDDTPRYDVPCVRGWGCGAGFGHDVPIPDDAMPDPKADGHMAVVDLAHNLSYEFYQAQRTDSGWQAGYGIVFNITARQDQGTFVALGVTQPLGYQHNAGRASARASGTSLLGGLVRYQELENGLIPHALAFAYPYAKGDAFVAPATHTTGILDPDITRWDNLPVGARIRLKPSVDVAARCNGNRACETIGRAMQHYGMFLVDRGDAATIFAEGLYGKDVSWDGLLAYEDIAGFGAWDFEVLQLPPAQYAS